MYLSENRHAALAALEEKGWVVIPAFFPGSLVDEVSAQLEPALALRGRIRALAGVEGKNDGTLHHLLADHPSFLTVLDRLQPLDPLIGAFFNGKYVLNSYGGVVNAKSESSYVHQVHRDIRFSSDSKRFMLNLLIMLDDFTPMNGATRILSHSHRLSERPASDIFSAQAELAVGARGSILIFDSRVWHAAGENQTSQVRRALTLTLTCPFFKPQLDYPKLLGPYHPARENPFLRQFIGYNARVPATLEEFYLPVTQRFYQRGQDD